LVIFFVMDNVFIQFRQKFIDEALRLIQVMEKNLLDLENDASNHELIEEIFRAMHTIKGVSSMYGFDRISEYTHRLETIYEQIRDGKHILTEVVIDLTLESVDHLKNLLDDEDFVKEYNQFKHKFLLEALDKELTAKKATPELVAETSEKTSTPADSAKTYYIYFRPDESLFHRAVNIVGLFEDLSRVGQFRVFKHGFAEIEGIDNLDDDAWGILVTSPYPIEDIEDVFMFVEDNCKIIKLANSDLFDNLNLTDSTEALIAKYRISDDETPESKNFDTESEPIVPQVSIPENSVQKPATPDKIVADTAQKIKVEIEDLAGLQSNKHISSVAKQLKSRIAVDAEKLDYLMFLVSEMVTTNAQLTLANRKKDAELLDRAVERIEKLSKQFRENALSLRLVPINDVVVRFQRLIRDLSHNLGKEVRFETQGTDTEIDKSIIDVLTEPLMHIIRNCIDHGIETPEKRISRGKPREGVVKLSAYYSGRNVFIRIEDDGNGIDTNKIVCKAVEKGLIEADAKLSQKEIYDILFLPGFTTAESLTQVSGRGVGMDVVRKKITEVRGEVTVESKLGEGSAFIIKLQQTVSIMDALLVRAENTHFLIPISEIEVCDQRAHNELFENENKLVQYNQSLIPFVHLRTEFELEGNCPRMEKIIIINHNQMRIAIVADKIIGEHQAVLKPLGHIFKRQEFLLGASIMGDGNMALMIDTLKLTETIFSIKNKKISISNS